jgi:transposase
VDRITCFRGFKAQAAMVIATELGDLRRFENPRQLMAYLGLVPREHSSGERRRQGAITKAGNTRVRHVLIQAAWHYRKRPAVGAPLRRRQKGQDPDVIRHAWKCQHRLYTLFHRLAARKPNQVAATAVGRELVGFLWAVLREVDVAELQEVTAA